MTSSRRLERGLNRIRSTSVRREEGQTMAEYAFLLGLVTLVALGAYAAFGAAVLNLLVETGRRLFP